MSIISNASYKIFSREEFKAFRKLNGNSQWNYDFGYKVIIQFYGKHHGYTSATDAITALVVDFKNTKIREFSKNLKWAKGQLKFCLLYTSPSPRDVEESRMPSSA